MGTLINALVLPDYPQKYHRRMAVQTLQYLQIQFDQNQNITYTNLGQYILKICSNTIENIDLRSCLGFLDLILPRITDLFVVDVEDPDWKQKIPCSMKVSFYDPEQVVADCGVAQKRQSQQVKKLYFAEYLTQKRPQEIPATRCYLRQLKKSTENVIPLGYVAQQFLHDFINGFQLKSSYRLKGCKKVDLDQQKIDYYAEVQNTDVIRDKVVNQQIFETSFVLGNDALQSIAVPGQDISMYRVNGAFSKQNYYQKLQQLKSGTHNYYNILSQYYDRDQFNIDELQLTRQKLMTRRKEHLLGIVGKQTIKKQVRDYDDQFRILGFKICQQIVDNLNEKRMQDGIKALATNLRNLLDQQKNISTLMEKNLSKFDKLVRDSPEPFDQDVISYAKITPLQIIIIGRPKSGKSALAKAIANKYNLVCISVEGAIEKLFERVKFFEENPPETDEDGNVIGGLLPLQKVVLDQLNSGKKVDPEDLLDLMNMELKSEAVSNKGFILDLPLEYHGFWSNCIISYRLQLPKICTRYFTHVIQIEQTQEQWKYFNQGIMQKPQQLTISSKFDRYLITKPKPPPEQGQQDLGQQEQKPAPLIQTTLIKKGWKDSSPAIIDHLTKHIHPSNFIKIHNSYQSTEECLKLTDAQLYILPLAKKIQGAQKQLLSVGLQQAKVFRKWSPWGLVDCVELHKGKLIMGKFQFAADYVGRVFVFENQNNLNTFLGMPRKYLQKSPQIPNNTNICIVGPRKSGKKTIAKMLADIYKLRMVDIQQILGRLIDRQKSFQSHVPSNPQKRSTAVHLSEGQLKQFLKGSQINAKDILPMILFELGVALQKKPPGWGVQKLQQQGENKQQVPEEKKQTKKPKKKDNKVGDDDRPKTPPLDDLALKEIIPELNHFGKISDIKGFVIVGYPNNEQQLNSLKSFNIPVDKMIVLADSNQEAPNKILGQRLNDAELEQVALFGSAIGPVKEALTEEVARQFQIDKTPEQITNKIRQFIDPFYLKCDDDAINRVIADKAEQGDPIPLGFCGDYCPVSLSEGWLIKGKEEFQAGVRGKRYRFSGEKQINLFKQNPQKYISPAGKKTVVPPRIMLMGVRGVGLRTQLGKLNGKYKVPILSLKDTLIQQIENQKQKRKSERYYNKGFKIPQFDEQGKQVQDPELNEESPDFDKRANQISVTKNIFSGIQQIFINGNFFDVDQEKVSTGIVQLLSEARRLPEVVLMLNCDEGKWLERVMNKKAIQEQLEQIKQRRRQQKQKEKEQARKKAQENGQEYQEPAEQQEDPQIPKLQDMIAQKEESLKAQRQGDSGKLQQLTQAFKALNIEVINIKCQRGVKHVTDRINSVLHSYLQDRFNTNWEKNQMLPIQRHRVQDFINNFICKDSRFGKLNPFTLMKPIYPYPLIYKDRIYYLQNQEERDAVMRNSKLLQTNLSVPLDIKVVPSVFVIGKTKTGRTTLVDSVSKKLGLIKLDIRDIINEFTQDHNDFDIDVLMKDLRSGKTLTDQNIVMLIGKRVSMHDCQSNGWILDGFPTNKKQCQLLNKKGLAPFNVFSIELSDFQIKKRVLAANCNDLYDWDMEVVQQRLQKSRKNYLEVQAYCVQRYNNFKKIDGHLSKWGIFEAVKTQIMKTVKARRQFVRALATRTPAAASKIGLSYNSIINNLSDYSIFCPASYKIRRQYVRKCPRHHEFLSLFNKKVYLLNSQKELNDFINNPDIYINKGKAFSPPNQIPCTRILQIENKLENKAYCMVELTRNKLVKGNYSYILHYKGKNYGFGNPHNMKLFMKNPALYQMATLQDKLPVQFEKKSELKKIAKKNDCTAFLQHHLSNILMRSLAQLGYRRPKYPTLGSKQSALKFLAISLKANNPNKDEEYRQKYSEKLKKFNKECHYTQQIRQELDRKEKETDAWQVYDQENLLKLCEEFHAFLNELQQTEKTKYFSQFIR